MIMVFANKISQLREGRKLLQCHLTAAFDMDTPKLIKLIVATVPQSNSGYCHCDNPFYK